MVDKLTLYVCSLLIDSINFTANMMLLTQSIYSEPSPIIPIAKNGKVCLPALSARYSRIAFAHSHYWLECAGYRSHTVLSNFHRKLRLLIPTGITISDVWKSRELARQFMLFLIHNHHFAYHSCQHHSFNDFFGSFLPFFDLSLLHEVLLSSWAHIDTEYSNIFGIARNFQMESLFTIGLNHDPLLNILDAPCFAVWWWAVGLCQFRGSIPGQEENPLKHIWELMYFARNNKFPLHHIRVPSHGMRCPPDLI